MQASFSQVGTDRTALVGDSGMKMTIDDGVGFIILPDATSNGDTTRVDEESANLYTVVRTSGTKFFLYIYSSLHFRHQIVSLYIHIFLFNSSPSSLSISCNHNMQALFKP